MVWLLYGLAAIFVLFVAAVFWGIVRIRQSVSQASAAIASIELGEIDRLAQECVDVFDRKLGVRLDVDDWQQSAAALDDAFRRKDKLVEAFERPDLRWYFVKPVGAFLGELLRRHADHRWQAEENGAPSMIRMIGEGSLQSFPFEKVIKQATLGEQGDLLAYVVMARGAGEAVAQLPP
jgi:hypothetical protein